VKLADAEVARTVGEKLEQLRRQMSADPAAVPE
jgi:hypothetical protein